MEDSPEPYSRLLFSPIPTLQANPVEAVFGIALMLVLLFVSAMVSGSEVAFFSLKHPQLESLRQSGKPVHRMIIRLLEKPKRLLATILIVNNLVNIAIIILSTLVFRSILISELHPALAFSLQVIVVTFLILVFAEVLPKVYASHHALGFASLMAPPLLFLRKSFYPLSSILVRSTGLIDKRMARKQSGISMSELSHALEITTDEKTTEEDRNILKSIVAFGNIDAREIMKARVDVVAVDIQTPFDELIKVILEAGYSRIPVYRENFDNVEGILYIKDLLPYLGKEKNFQWQQLIRACFFVPESKKINDLLKEFQEKKIHLAMVVDEYGGTAGIITLEDILEEIVGEINDEFDMEEALYSRLDPATYIFEGKTLLKDFCKITQTDYELFSEIKGEADTLAGMILEITGELPKKGRSIAFRHFDFIIEGVDKRRIKRVKVKIRK